MIDKRLRLRIRAAVNRLPKLYPPIISHFLIIEILLWEQFGYRIGGYDKMIRLTDSVLRMPIPGTVPQPKK